MLVAQQGQPQAAQQIKMLEVQQTPVVQQNDARQLSQHRMQSTCNATALYLLCASSIGMETAM